MLADIKKICQATASFVVVDSSDTHYGFCFMRFRMEADAT
jgi:hypothetical protein